MPPDAAMELEFDPDPNHPSLFADKTPHELSGLLRAKRNQWPPRVLVEMFGLEGDRLSAALQRGLDQEHAAIKAGRKIHNPRFA